MANTDAAFGLRPYNMLGEGVNSNGIQKFKIQLAGTAGTSSVIYQGTPVIPLANGLIDIVGAAAGGTVPLLGAFIGCEYTDLNGTPTFTNKWPGTASVKSGTQSIAHVSASPDQLFLINCDAAATDAAVHANANFASGTSGDTTTGISSAELAASAIARLILTRLLRVCWLSSSSTITFTVIMRTVRVLVSREINDAN